MTARNAFIPLMLVLAVLAGCGGDRAHPEATTDSDRMMESYLTKVEKIGSLLAEVKNESDAGAVSNQVLLVVEDMRELIPRMKAIDKKQQAQTMSKYRVRINKVNEQFAKNITHFVTIPGASEDLIKQLKSLPPLIEDTTSTKD
ncbi:MAG: hypothetical protein R3C45_09275 [Phycisphaerales bacterium]